MTASTFEAPLDPFVRGAVCVARTPTGIAPLRAPESAFVQMPGPFTREVFRMTSGVRLAFSTEATALELDVAVSRMRWEVDPPSTVPAVFDLVADGVTLDSRGVEPVAYRVFRTDGAFLEEQEPAPFTLRFDGLAPVCKEVEVWLPATAAVELRGLRADAALDTPAAHRPRWVHYGSSISHCIEARRPTETWPAVAARRAAVELLNLGVAGNCHLDPFVARTIRDAPADCVSLKVGINIAGSDSLKHRTFVPAMHGFLDTIRDGHPDTPILVVSPIICPVLEDTPAAADGLTLVRVRELLAEIVDARAGVGEQIHYLDGLRLFAEPDLAELPDGVHPSPEGYLRIGERFAAAAFPNPLSAARAEVR